MSLLTSLLSMNTHQCVSEGCLSQAATTAGTTPCLNPEILLSPSLLAVVKRGKGSAALWFLRVCPLVNRQASAVAPRSQEGRFLFFFFYDHTAVLIRKKAQERNTQRLISLTKLCGGHFPSYLCVLSLPRLLSTFPISPPKPDSRRI